MSIVQGLITETQEPAPGGTTFIKRGWYQEQQTYNPGGITFNYPAGLFSAPPTVFVSVQLTGLPYLTTILPAAMVVSNTALATTVRVNILSGVVGEAGANVTVHLRAI